MPTSDRQGAHMKLIIGNKNYSSWSLRGWLAIKQSGLAFEELTVNIGGDEWEVVKRQSGEIMPAGKVPILWDGDTVVWDSLAIIDFLADRVGRDRFWPAQEPARAMARSMAAEMHASFPTLRRDCPMNVRRRMAIADPSQALIADVGRVLELWAQARARHGGGGPYLFGTFSAADIMYAPVVTRFYTYGFKLPPFAAAYSQAILTHPWMAEWIAAANAEDWVLEQYEHPAVAE